MAEQAKEGEKKEVMLTVHVRVPRLDEDETLKVVNGIRKAVSTYKDARVRYNVGEPYEALVPLRRQRRR